MGRTVTCTEQSAAETRIRSLCRVLLRGVLLSPVAAGQWLGTFNSGGDCNGHGNVQSTVPL